mgnify:FL=1
MKSVIAFPLGRSVRKIEPQRLGHRLFVEKALLASYFDGSLRDFTLPTVAPGTDLQQNVWGALCEISYGEARSYGELAATVGRPAAVRAVGRVNGLNALAIVVPCRRVVGADGKLVGYGGVWRKQKLLAVEGV